MGIRLPSRKLRLSSRVLALAMALSAIVSIRAAAAPGDIYQMGAPAIGSAPPKAADISAGDASVSTQTGAFQYGYPIPVPPGRNGMKPSLSLAYSSQSPIYGGIANGWALGVAMISLDTSNGRLVSQELNAPKPYVSSMAGGRPLIPVTEPMTSDAAQAYRA